MSVEINGLNKLINQLESKFGQDHMQKVSDDALKSGADVFVKELRSQFDKFANTGASRDEITVSEPMTEGGVRKIKVYWEGPRDRYRIIHLNEYGTVKNPNPEGKGAIAKSLRSSRQAYKGAIEKAVKEGF